MMASAENHDAQKTNLNILLLGLLLGFLHVSLFRELSLKIPTNFFFPHFLILAFSGLAAGLLYGKRPYAYVKAHPSLLLLFLTVFLFGIWVYRNDSIFFWTLAMYYPMPIPEYGWIRALVFLTALVSLPILFFLLACPLAENLEASQHLGRSFSLFFLGMTVATLLGYPAQFLGPEVMFLCGAMALFMFVVRRPRYWILGLLISAGIIGYGFLKRNYPILLSLKDYQLLESRMTDNYKIDFYQFRDNTCAAQAINDFLHVYTCRDHEDLPVELSYLNRVLSEGLEDYRALIMGCSIGLYPPQLFHANPRMERCVMVDVDRQLADTVIKSQKAIGLDLYDDERFSVKAFEPRYYLDHETETYDLLYLHRIGNALIYYPYSIVPIEYYLLTKESLDHIFDHLLVEDGVYIQDWGIPDEKEVKQFVVSLPDDVFFRAYWTTVSNNPLSGAPLIFVLASRSQDRLDQIAARLEQASFFHEVRQMHWPKGYAITDDKPWLKHDVVIILTCCLLPFLFPLAVVYARSRRLEAPPAWLPGGGSRRYYLLFGVLFSLSNAYVLGRATRLFFLGVNPGWLLVEAALFAGVAAGVSKSFAGLFQGRRAIFFLLLSLLGCVDVYLLDTLKSFPLALLLVILHGFLLGQVFGFGLPAAPRGQRSFLYGTAMMGTAFGIALFQVVVLLLGFLATGFLSALLILAAGLLFPRKGNTLLTTD